MEVGLIVPIPELRHMHKTGFHLVLSHLLGNKEYASFYRDRRAKGDYLILDNGAHELGISQDHQTVLSNCKLLGAQELVLPDVLFDKAGTIERTKRMLKYLATDQGWSEYAQSGYPRLMMVPQGKERPDWAYCFFALLKEWDKFQERAPGRVDYPVLGISKDYDDWRGGLQFLIDKFVVPERKLRQFQIHLLGWPSNLWTLAGIARKYPWIRSTDSARPTVYAKHNILLEPGGKVPVYPKRDPNYFTEELTEHSRMIADRNTLVYFAAVSDELILAT